MLVIDVEIAKAIPPRDGEPLLEGISYCKGWRDFENMGIACVCVYDVATHLSRVFLDTEEDISALKEYLYGKQTAGFNTKRFDLPLLRAHGVDIDFGPSVAGTHYDILEQIWVAQGLDPNKFNPRTHGGWGLDAVCKATLGTPKTGNGALALVWWQQGKHGRVIDYCLNDCHMEGTLLQWIIDGNPVRNAAGSVVRVEPPRIQSCQSSSISQESVSDDSGSPGGLGFVRAR